MNFRFLNTGKEMTLEDSLNKINLKLFLLVSFVNIYHKFQNKILFENSIVEIIFSI